MHQTTKNSKKNSFFKNDISHVHLQTRESLNTSNKKMFKPFQRKNAIQENRV